MRSKAFPGEPVPHALPILSGRGILAGGVSRGASGAALFSVKAAPAPEPHRGVPGPDQPVENGAESGFSRGFSRKNVNFFRTLDFRLLSWVFNCIIGSELEKMLQPVRPSGSGRLFVRGLGI